MKKLLRVLIIFFLSTSLFAGGNAVAYQVDGEDYESYEGQVQAVYIFKY